MLNDKRPTVNNPICDLIEDANKHHFKIVHVVEKATRNPKYSQINVVYIVRKPKQIASLEAEPATGDEDEISGDHAESDDVSCVTEEENIIEVTDCD